MNNDRINQEVVAIEWKATKLTSRMLFKLCQLCLKKWKEVQKKPSVGKQRVKDLVQSGSKIAEPIELSNNYDFKLFDKTMRRFGVDYSVRFDRDQEKHYLFFKAKDTETINHAFQYYTSEFLRDKDKKRSILDIVKDNEKQLKNKTLDHVNQSRTELSR